MDVESILSKWDETAAELVEAAEALSSATETYNETLVNLAEAQKEIATLHDWCKAVSDLDLSPGARIEVEEMDSLVSEITDAGSLL